MRDTGQRARLVPVSTGTVCIQATEVRGCKVMEARFPADLRIPTHTHEGACVSVVMEGEFSERVMRRDRACFRGSVLAKPPLESHDDTFGRFGSRQLIIEIAPGTLAALYAHGQPWDNIVHARAAEADALARSVVHELLIADSASPLAIEGLTLELLVCVWRMQKNHARRRPPAWLLRARDCLSDQFHLPLTVGHVAADAGVHPTHLAREFRAHFGESVGHYVRRLRVEWSKAQLLTTDHALATIAVRAGFSDQAHFTRWFKRQTGVTPHRYRSARRHDAVAAD
ncbi:MAG: helix-turn-helix transcriptional regulator [Longimicrobiales bacterium]